jgi:hypothetical protein
VPGNTCPRTQKTTKYFLKYHLGGATLGGIFYLYHTQSQKDSNICEFNLSFFEKMLYNGIIQ